MKITVFILGAMLMACSSTQVKQETTPQEGHAELSLEVESYTLDNGLTVLLSHDSRLPVVAVEIRYLVGSANEVANILKRMRELLVEGSSDTLNSTERSYINTELSALTSEVDRIAQVSEFNGIKLGNTASISLAVQVGVHNTSNDRITIKFQDLQTIRGLSLATMNIDVVAATMRNQISVVDTALDRLNSARAEYGSTQNRLSSALNNLEVYTENMESAQSQIRDADFAHETAEMAKFQIMAQAGTSVLAQANQINQGALRLLG